MTPTEFEKASLEWLSHQDNRYPDAVIEHNVTVRTRNGDYQLDGKITFSAYNVPFVIIIECKMYTHPVKRDALVALQDKVQEMGAQKGILVTTASFQRGAIQYAKNKGITLIRLKGANGDFSPEYYTDFTESFLRDDLSVRFPKMLTDPPTDIPLSYVPRKTDKAGVLQALKAGESILMHGLGGVGKTILAKDIVRTIRQRPSQESGIEAVAWVNCAGGSLKSSLLSALHETKELISPEDAWIIATNIIEHYQKKLLIVADNLESLPLEEQEQLNDLPCCVLATSRLSVCGALRPYLIKDLSRDDCETLFLNFYKGPKDMPSLHAIVDLADYHAVTIELLAKIANLESVSLAEFKHNLINHGFDISQEKIAADHEALVEERKIMEQISILFSMSRCTLTQIELLTKLSVLPSIPFQYAQVHSWLGLSSRGSLKQLSDLGWITASGNFSPTYQMHSTVAAAIRDQCKENLYRQCRPVIENLLDEMTVSDQEHPYQKKQYITFSWAISDLLRDDLCDETDVAFLETLAAIYEAIGNFERALELNEHALVIRKRLTSNPKSLITSWLSIGNLLIQISKYDKAEKCLQRACQIAQKAPSNDRGIMLAKHYLAVNATKLCAYSKAARRYAAAEKFYSRDDLADLYDRAVFYIDYGSFYRDYMAKDYYKKSETFYKKGISLFEEAKLTTNPEYATALCQFGLLYHTVGNYPEALAILQKALQLQKTYLDDFSPDIADTYATLGLIEYDLGQLPSAKKHTKKALKIYSELYSETHEAIASVYNNLGLIYTSIPGCEGAAECAYLRALTIREALYPDGIHLKLAESYNNLAQLYEETGELDNARTYFDKALKIYEKLNADVEDRACVLDNSANLAVQEEDFLKARQDAELALKIRERIMPDSYSCSYSYNTIGLIDYYEGKYDKAITNFKKSISLKGRYLRKHVNGSLGTVHFNYALALEALRDFPAATEEYEIAEQIYRKIGWVEDAEHAKRYKESAASRQRQHN